MMKVAKALALAVLGCAGLFSSAAAQVPDVVNQEGLLYDAQARPLEGAVNMVFKLYPLAAGGAPIWTETHNGVALFEGYYAVALGGTVPLTPAVLLQGTWLGIEIDGGAQLVPRIKMNSVPFALIAADLEPTVDLTINSLAIGGQPVINDQGRWVGDPTGLVGPQGPQGAVGPQGARGVQGPQGPVGAIGPQGVAGVAGVAGAAGNDGAQGVQGLQGSPDTPAQVRAKLLTVDGAGSNIDADRLDGLTSGQFLRRDLAATSKPTVTSRLHVRGDHTDLGTQGQTGLRFRNDGTKHAALRFDGTRTLFVEDASTAGAVAGGAWTSAANPTDLEVRNGALRVNGSGNVTGNLNVNGYVRPGAGAGNKGILFPANPFGGGGDIAWLRYIQEAGENARLELGITNDSNDNIALNATGGVDITGSGDLRTGRDTRVGRTLAVAGSATVAGNATINGTVTGARGNKGFTFPNAGDDYAWLRFVDQGGDNRALQLGVGNNGDDDVEIWAPGGLSLAAPGAGPIKIEFPDNRWGGAGDDAWIRYYSEGGENTALEIGIGNDPDDNLILNAGGGVTIAGNGDLVVNRNLVVNGNCVGCEAAGIQYKPIYASHGSGDNGIVFQNQGASGDDAWIRYYTEGGDNRRLQLGINNDTDDDIELYTRAPIQLRGAGGGTLGFTFANGYFGGNDRAHIQYFSEGGTNTKLRIANYDDADDDIELYSNALVSLRGPGTNPIGFQFQASRYGGGDQAYIRFESQGGSNTQLEIGISNDSDDDIYLNASGGVTIANRLTVNGTTAINGGTTITGNARITGTGRVDSTLDVYNDLRARRNFRTYGSATVSTDLAVSRNASVTGNLRVGGTLTINTLAATNVTASNDVTAGRRVVTGGMVMHSNGTLTFPSACCNATHQTKLRLYGTTYSMGIDSGTLRFNTHQYFRFYAGGTQGVYFNNGEIFALRGMDVTGTTDFRSTTYLRGTNYMVGRTYLQGTHYHQGTSYHTGTTYYGSDNRTQIQGRSGKNYFVDNEAQGRLRVGAVWGYTGIYAEDAEDLAVGASGGDIYIGQPQGTYGSQRLRADRVYARNFYGGTFHGTFSGTFTGGIAGYNKWAGQDPCPAGWNTYGTLCFYNSRRGATHQTLVSHYCATQLGARLCTDSEVALIRGWRGWFGGNFWYADAYSDDAALFHNCNCGGYWYNHDGGSSKASGRYAYCCRTR
jgi:hypothetical protein